MIYMREHLFWLLMIGVGLCLLSCEGDRGFADCKACNEYTPGFVRNFSPDGASLVITVSSPDDMQYDITVRGMSLDRESPAEAVLLTGEESFSFAFTEPGQWMDVTVPVNLRTGLNQLKIMKAPDTSGSFRIDWLEYLPMQALEVFPFVAVERDENEEHGGESPEG